MRWKGIVGHYESISVKSLMPENLFVEIYELFNRDEIPWDNLVLIICVIKKSGRETKLCKKHLIYLTLMVCHHIHNTVKNFCAPFSYFLEKLMDDLHTDSKYSTDICHAM